MSILNFMLSWVEHEKCFITSAPGLKVAVFCIYRSVNVIVTFLNPSVQNYANMPMPYTEIFHGCKNDNFHMENSDIFLIFAQNVDYGYTFPQSIF